MAEPDLNLLLALDVLLDEGNVTRAARQLRLSPSAMSRTLARLRAATGDPLLVRAGRSLVPTPRASALREQVRSLVQQSQAVLRPAQDIDLQRLERSFTIRSSDGFVENFGPALVAMVGREAPGVRLHLMHKADRDSAQLRAGTVDLETGVLGAHMGPELRTQALFSDRFVGVVRSDHPLCRGAITVERYAQGRHVMVSRRGLDHGPIDDALQALGHQRRVVTVVGGFAAALELARGSDLIASVPLHHCAGLRQAMFSFELPLPLPGFSVSMFWHPRHQADAAHRWLRECVLRVCSPASGAASIDE